MQLKGLDCENVGGHIVHWLKAYAKQAGSQGFVVGISGGVDSALTSALCARTGLRLICVQMPIHQASDQLQRATHHIDKLTTSHPQVEERTFDLSPVFDQFSQTLSSEQSAQREGFGQCTGPFADDYALSRCADAWTTGRGHRQ